MNGTSIYCTFQELIIIWVTTDFNLCPRLHEGKCSFERCENISAKAPLLARNHFVNDLWLFP